MAKKHHAAPLRDLLRVPLGEPVDLSAYDAGATPGGPDGKAAGRAATVRMGRDLAGLQERLWAAATAGDRRRILLVLQGMDTSGKGGTVKHVIGLFNPAGCRIHAFKAPTPEERQHDFLWRVAKELPHPGEIGIFDRSHYEDVLIAKVRSLAPDDEIESRYGRINGFETSLTDDGVTILKCFLHISYDEQRRRLLKRLAKPHKRWKFNPGDIDERGAIVKSCGSLREFRRPVATDRGLRSLPRRDLGTTRCGGGGPGRGGWWTPSPGLRR